MNSNRTAPAPPESPYYDGAPAAAYPQQHYPPPPAQFVGYHWAGHHDKPGFPLHYQAYASPYPVPVPQPQPQLLQQQQQQQQQQYYPPYPNYAYAADGSYPTYPHYDDNAALPQAQHHRPYKNTAPPPPPQTAHPRWQPYPQYAAQQQQQHPDVITSAIALARDESRSRLSLQESPTITSSRPSSKTSSLTSMASASSLFPPSPIMGQHSPVQRPAAISSFIAHSPLSTAGTFSPYLGPMLHTFDDGCSLDMFAGIDSLGTTGSSSNSSSAAASRNSSRRLSASDAMSVPTSYIRSLSPALLTGPGIGTSPQMLSDDDVDLQPYPTPGLEGLFDDLALIAGFQDSDDPRSVLGTAGSSDTASVISLNLQQQQQQQQPIPNLVVSAPDATTPTAVSGGSHSNSNSSSSSSSSTGSDLKSPTRRPHRRRVPSSPAPSNDSPDPADFTIPSGVSNSDFPSGGMFSCACGKSFKKLSSLRSHAKLHGRERSFVCDQCNKGFLRKHDLTRHTTTHLPHGAKPYTCPHPLCGVTFTRQDAMKRHWVRKCQYRTPPPPSHNGYIGGSRQHEQQQQQWQPETSPFGPTTTTTTATASTVAATTTASDSSNSPASSIVAAQNQEQQQQQQHLKRPEFTPNLTTTTSSPHTDARMAAYPVTNNTASMLSMVGFVPPY
ncbi:Strongly-conserved Zn-finger binding protein (TFIIIA) [Geranomyces michiganensis]|nr:Strongly-conserved Zn-finger binding protein (TFIIIA) [Geranomyces michiganensis]